jgi:hypothetical protein
MYEKFPQCNSYDPTMLILYFLNLPNYGYVVKPFTVTTSTGNILKKLLQNRINPVQTDT